MASLFDLMSTYMSDILPRYSTLEKQLTATGKEDLKIMLNWVRDVFGALNIYATKAKDLEREKVALAEENSDLRNRIQRLTQEKKELEQAVELALGLEK